MKICIFIFLSILLITTFLFTAGWNYCIIDDGISSDLKVDSMDRPHIVYGGLSHTYYDGDDWIFEDIGGTTGGIPSIEFDSGEILHISYYDGSTEDLMYCYWDGDEWIVELIDDEDQCGQSNSLAIDSDGYPHIVYSYYNGDRELRYAYKDVVCWNYYVVDDEGGGKCELVLDSQDYPHISYAQLQPNYEVILKYAHWDGVSWQLETVDDEEVGSFPSTSIVVDSQNHPHISYKQQFNCKYAYNDGSGWNIEFIDNGEGDVSIALDSSDNPHIAYCAELSTYMSINYASWNGYSWDIEIACIGTGLLGQLSVSLDLDSNDNPHISCDEYIYLDIWYIWYGEPHQDILLTTFSAVDKGSKAMVLNWSVESTEGEVIEGFNLYRREVGLIDTTTSVPGSEDTHPRWTRINEHLITGQNPYSYIDDTVENGVTYEYRLEAVVEEEAATIGTTQGTCGLPTSFVITSIHPNPATDEVSIILSTPQTTDVKIEVYDITGRLVKMQEVGEIESGEYIEVISMGDLSSGVYTVKATAGVETSTEKMVIVR